MSIYDDGDDTADEDAENGSKDTETQEDPPAPDLNETGEDGRGTTVDVSGIDLDGPPEGEVEAPSDDTGGVEELEADADDADGGDGLGVVAVLVGVVILLAAVRNRNENQTPTIGPGR